MGLKLKALMKLNTVATPQEIAPINAKTLAPSNQFFPFKAVINTI